MNQHSFSWQRTKPSAYDRESAHRQQRIKQDGIHKKNPLQEEKHAPEFSLRDTPDQKVSLSDFLGNPVILLFYPADFSPVCSDEVALYNEVLPEFHKYSAHVLGISVDNVWCHLAFAKERNLHFPLLSDFHPKGEVSQTYNAYREEEGESERALYLIDEDGMIAWGYISPIGANPGVDGVLQALEDLHKKNKEER